MDKNTKGNRRWWFAVYRLLKDAGKVMDLGDMERYMYHLFGKEQPLPISVKDLSVEMDVMTFVKPFEQWIENSAPRGPKMYRDYSHLAMQLRKLFLNE